MCVYTSSCYSNYSRAKEPSLLMGSPLHVTQLPSYNLAVYKRAGCPKVSETIRKKGFRARSGHNDDFEPKFAPLFRMNLSHDDANSSELSFLASVVANGTYLMSRHWPNVFRVWSRLVCPNVVLVILISQPGRSRLHRSGNKVITRTAV